MGISFLTVLVFYLPSDSGEKVIYTLHSSSFPHPLHGHLLPHWACVLPAFQQRREGNLHFTLIFFLIPCMGISFLTGHVFYLPSNSGEKVIYTLLSSSSSSPA
ncbi:hypothetical protein PR048_032090 [Dryococelus australis]|uniref:Uncharacterized protein n=1 Tax=Dryococelus australis TaxID=614101 RepID=A0ABQ9G482_9NEOP|nr:hypothetical protein PR048_032090 [Dryococelus australis]